MIKSLLSLWCKLRGHDTVLARMTTWSPDTGRGLSHSFPLCMRCHKVLGQFSDSSVN